MKNLLGLLFDTDGFTPRWNCGDWTTLHGWVHIFSDLAIFGAYAAIPVALVYFVLKRKDVPFPPIFWLFGAFILACGTGHLVESTLFWRPWYRFSGLVKVFTALVSWATVIALIRVLPRALELPGLAKISASLGQEIAERRKAEAELRRTAAFDLAILDASLDAVISIDVNGRVVVWNRAAERIFGFTAGEARGRLMEELIIPDSLRERHRRGIERAAAGGEVSILNRLIEMPAIRKDGSGLTVELFITRIDAEGLARFTGFARDITERKQVEAQRQVAFAETETLLKEVHHRVKNNMQVISSLLRLHSGKLRDPVQRAVFDDCRDRIRAMALIHERLYSAGQFARIEFGGYLSEMVRTILAANTEAGARVKLDLQLDRLDVNLDTAMPLSLIASELVINSVKHAFAGGRAGTLTVRLRAGGTIHELIVQDDGPGLPAKFSPDEGFGIGIELVENLTRQIRGEREFASGVSGATVTVRWPA